MGTQTMYKQQVLFLNKRNLDNAYCHVKKNHSRSEIRKMFHKIMVKQNTQTFTIIASNFVREENTHTTELVVPTPYEGEELYTQMGFFCFFVQSIFPDRYIHRRELRLVSLKSTSSVEYGIKKVF